MADFFVDETHTNNGDGDGWADQVGAGGAFNTLESALSAASGGDNVYVRAGSTPSGATRTFTGPLTIGNPVHVLGVKAATTAAPPVQADLVPGILTGDATRAYDQTAGNAAPTMGAGGTDILDFVGALYFYGIKFTAGGAVRFGANAVGQQQRFDECDFQWGSSDRFEIRLFGHASDNVWRRCQLTFANATTQRLGLGNFARLVDCEFTFQASLPALLIDLMQSGAVATLDSCDLSGFTGTVIDISDADTRGLKLDILNSVLNASATLFAGAPSTASRYIVQYFGTEEDGTAKTAGESRRQMQIETHAGTVLNDTSFTRAGGANDGASGAFARKMTPHVNMTREGYVGLSGPWENVWIAGDGTSKTLSAYIANNGGADLQDDEVALEITYPSEAGGAKHDYKTSLMRLLGTPADVTDDTTSDWNSGGAGSNNAQTLSLSIAPDYEGPLRWRIIFYKRFAASPDSLYYDPKADIS